MLIKTTDHDWTFESTEDVLDFMDTVTSDKHESMKRKQGSSFNKYSWEETTEHLKHGFTTEKMFYQKEQLTKIVNEELTKLGIKYDVTGDYLDVGTYMTGQPECFAQFDYFPEDKPLINIIINISKSTVITPELVENRGIAIASLIETLKSSYNIRCYLVKATEYMKYNTYFRFNLNVNGFASFNQLMTYIGHTGFYRRTCFCMLERMFNRFSCDNDGYGRPIDVTEFDQTKTLYFKPMRDNYDCEESYGDLEKSKRTILEIVEDLKKKQKTTILKYT